MKLRFLVCLGLFGLLIPSAAHADVSYCDSVSGNLVQNCGFETGDFTGWTLSGNPGFISVGTDPVNSGTYAAVFGAVGSLTYLSQSLTTTPGDLYDLSFYLANDGGCDGDCEFDVSWNGTTIYDTTSPPSPLSFTQFAFDGLSATTSSTALEFSFQQNPAFFQFDDAVVTPETGSPEIIPEPGTFVLWFLGAMSLVAVTWWKRRTSSRAGLTWIG